MALLVLSNICDSLLIDAGPDNNIALSLTTATIGYVCYTVVLVSARQLERFVPTISSIMACGSILSLLVIFAVVMLEPFVGQALASIVATLILFWSVPVKGHIIARAIQRHWYVGIVIAMTIFLLQYVIYLTMTGSD